MFIAEGILNSFSPFSSPEKAVTFARLQHWLVSSYGAPFINIEIIDDWI
jgi:hypothetical protein